MAYLTAQTIPSGITCRSLFIPDDEQFIANVRGLLETFTFPETFVEFGALTPEEMAAAYVDMFDDFCFGRGPCKVIGEIVLWSGPTSPRSGLWLPCDGASLLRADYPDLFTVIGTTYGSADGTHFNLPDLRSRVPLAVGSGPGLSVYSLGDTGGEETHTLTTSEQASHTHVDAGHSHSEIVAAPNITTIGVGAPEPTAIPGVGATGLGYASLNDSGGNGAHNNLQPYIALTYLIVALD